MEVIIMDTLNTFSLFSDDKAPASQGVDKIADSVTNLITLLGDYPLKKWGAPGDFKKDLANTLRSS
jgi:hypothetical protein